MPSTIDVSADEALLMALLLGQFVDRQNKMLRGDVTAHEAEDCRVRIELATRLRAKLPLSIEYGPPDDDE